MNEQIIQLLETMAVKLGTTVEYLLTITTRNVLIENVMACVSVIAFIISYAWVCRILYLKYDVWKKKDAEGAIWLGVIFFTAVALLLIFIKIPSTIVVILNPEFYAIKNIVSMLQSIN